MSITSTSKRKDDSSVHFWLRPESISVTFDQVSALTDDEARYFMAELRWGEKGKQVCPDCGAVDCHYDYPARRQWRCKHCFRTFSVTTGTPFADRKIGYRRLLMAIFAFVIHQKGLAALALRRIIGGQYRTSFTLLHKIREAVMLTAPTEPMSGVIEIDGGHFSGRWRKPRKKKAFKKKSKAPRKYRQHRDKIRADEFEHHPNRRIIMVLRSVSAEPTGMMNRYTGKPITYGATRTVVAVCAKEKRDEVEALVRQYVKRGSMIRTDELTAYGNLKLMGYFHETVNHSEEFCSDEGVNQNQAESYFSRMRRSCIGVYHRVAPTYMLDYASEMAWREDVRRLDTLKQLQSLTDRVFRSGISTDWLNYGRKGHKRTTELLFRAP